MLVGPRVLPGVFLGAFLVNITTAGSIATFLGVAAGNTLEGVVGAYLVNRYANGRKAFAHARDTFKFAILAGLLSTTVSATIGATSISLGGYASRTEFRQIWLTWWLGDAAGNLVVAPFLLLWFSGARVRWRPARLLEFVLLLGGLLLVTEVVFGGLFSRGAKNYPWSTSVFRSSSGRPSASASGRQRRPPWCCRGSPSGERFTGSALS